MAVLVGLLLALVPAPAAGQATEAWTVSPEPLLELGAVEGDPDHVFGSVRSARLLPDGRVVVADRDGRSIRVFGRDGDLAAAMGGEGDGPGEFRALAAMWVVPPDTIQALDPARPGVTTFLADGTLVGTTRLEATPPGDARGFPDVAAGRFSGGDLALGWTVGRVSSEPRRTTDRIVLGRFGPDGAFEGLLGEGTGLERYRGSPVVFSPYPHAAVLRDSVYFTDGDAAEVDVLGPRGGGVVRTLELPLAPGDAARGWSRLAEALRAGGEADRLGRLRPRRRPRPPLGQGLRSRRRRGLRGGAPAGTGGRVAGRHPPRGDRGGGERAGRGRPPGPPGRPSPGPDAGPAGRRAPGRPRHRPVAGRPARGAGVLPTGSSGGADRPRSGSRGGRGRAGGPRGGVARDGSPLYASKNTFSGV